MPRVISPLQEAIHKQTAKEMISEKILSLIASGILKVDDELPSERELAAMLSVSRETVRGAIQRLAGQGIVQVSQGARTKIARSDVDIASHRIGVTSAKAINGYSLAAVHEARLLVEKTVVADAAEHLSDHEISRLEESLETQMGACNDPVRFLICDREFHLTIYYGAKNRLLTDFVVDLYTYMLDVRRAAMSREGAIRRSIQDHAEIVRAVQARDPEAVAAAFEKHIQRIYDTTRLVNAADSALGEPAGDRLAATLLRAVRPQE